MRESRESIMKMNMEITDDSTQSALRTIKTSSIPGGQGVIQSLKG